MRSAGHEAQAVERQQRHQRLVVAVAAAGFAGAALAVAAAAREHALALAGAGDECAAGVAAFRARGGLREVHDRFAALVVDGDVLGLDRAAAPARGAAGAAERGTDRGFGAALDGDVAAAPAVHGRRLRVAAGDLDPRHVGAGAARIREGRALERVDLRTERPLRAGAARAFQVRRFARVAAMAGGGVAGRAALGDVEADRAGVEIAVARIAQVAEAALQRAAQRRLLVHRHETQGLRIRAAARDEVDGGELAARADADHDAVGGHVDAPAVDAAGRPRALPEHHVELALGVFEFGQRVARVADGDAGRRLLRAGARGRDDELEFAVALALDPAARELVALLSFEQLRLLPGEAFGLEVLPELGIGEGEVALHRLPECGRDGVFLGGGRCGGGNQHEGRGERRQDETCPGERLAHSGSSSMSEWWWRDRHEPSGSPPVRSDDRQRNLAHDSRVIRCNAADADVRGDAAPRGVCRGFSIRWRMARMHSFARGTFMCVGSCSPHERRFRVRYLGAGSSAAARVASSNAPRIPLRSSSPGGTM